jgi:hypothetical protein
MPTISRGASVDVTRVCTVRLTPNGPRSRTTPLSGGQSAGPVSEITSTNRSTRRQ